MSGGRKITDAFEATAEDVQAAMRKGGVEVSLDEAERVFAEHVEPELADVARAALVADGLEDQADMAQDHILRLLSDRGVLPSAPAP